MSIVKDKNYENYENYENIIEIIKSPNNIECLDLLYNIKKKFDDLALPILDKTTSEYSLNFVNMIRNFLYKIEEYPIEEEELE
jgi:uncharacterized protein YjgD (DUF1641 family)